MRTSTRITWGLNDLEYKQDVGFPEAYFTLQPHSNIDDLRTGNGSLVSYASYEQDFWLLDGSFKFLPTDLTTVHVGMVSQNMSDGSGSYGGMYPSLTMAFSFPHSTEGLTLHFSECTGDYPINVYISYYDEDDVLIETFVYVCDSTVFFADDPMADFSKVRILCNMSNRPYRYIRTGEDGGGNQSCKYCASYQHFRCEPFLRHLRLQYFRPIWFLCWVEKVSTYYGV
jgi:hypothetical protein